MEKKEVEFDEKLDVPKCYTSFFKSSPKSAGDANTSSKSSESKSKSKKNDAPVIKIKPMKEKNKDNTVATFPDSIKFPSKKLNQFQRDLRRQFSADVSYKENPLKISVSGNRPEELKEAIESFFELPANVIFEIEEKKISVKSDFKLFLTPTENGVIVTWSQRGSPHNLEDHLQQTSEEKWETTFQNESTKKEGKFIIFNVSKEIVRNHFMNTFDIDFKQIIDQELELPHEPKYHNELEFNYPNPLKQIQSDILSRNRYFYEMAATIIELLENNKKFYRKKEFHDNLEFTRVGTDRKGRFHKWNATIDAKKVFPLDNLSRALNLFDNVFVTYRNEKQIRGQIIEIDLFTGLVTARFLLAPDEKPPGYNETNEQSNIITVTDSDDENGNDDEEEQNEMEKKEYEEFLRNKIDLNKVDAEEEDEKDEAKEEERIIELVSKAKSSLKNEEEEEEEIIENKDGAYLIYFEKSEAFYEKCARALLCLRDSHTEIRRAITDNGYYEGDSRTIKIKDEPIDLGKSAVIVNREQKLSIEMILSNKISIVHGPPATGKSFLIGLSIYHILKRTREDEKQRILVCAKSNQALKNIVKYVTPFVQALGKKIVWVSYQTFDDKKQFEEATDEEKALVDYQIMTRKTVEAEKYQKLQREKWEYNDLVNRTRRKSNQKIPKFPSKQLNEMHEKKMLIESNLVYESDVVCCTISASAKWTIAHNKFNTIFIDDAQSANEMQSIIPLIHDPDKLVLLGDSKQLEVLVNPNVKEKHPGPTGSLYKKFMRKRVPNQLLSVQYRMNPLILQFPNQEFYQNRIQTATNVEENTSNDLPFIQAPITFVDVPNGNEKVRKDGSFINKYECFAVYKIVSNLKICQIKGKEVGVITPYYSQAQVLNKFVSSFKYKGLKVSTIEDFQGDERDYIIISLVRTKQDIDESVEFQPTKNKLNVALTRARKALFIVGRYNIFADQHSNKNTSLLNLCKFYQSKFIVEEDKIELLEHFVQKPSQQKKKSLIFTNTSKEKQEKQDDDLYEDQSNLPSKPDSGESAIEKLVDYIEGPNPDDDNQDDDELFEYDDDDDVEADQMFEDNFDDNEF